MGRWTPEYSDDVLASKVKNIISGAIKRSRLEPGEPNISYEALVEDLDEGDSFTTTLVELLVKEVADRRTRHSPADRSLIADRTARKLRSLAAHNRIYRGRTSTRARSRLNPSGSSAALDGWDVDPPRPDRLDDDEIDDALSESYAGIDGARIDTSLYDVYRPYNSISSSRRSFPFIASPHSGERGDVEGSAHDSPVNSHPSPPPLLSHITQPSSSGSAHSGITSFGRIATSLTRQPSIHRGVRSRTSDFNDFASRRRSTHRRNATNEPESVPTVATSQSLGRRSPIQEESLPLSSRARLSASSTGLTSSFVPWTASTDEALDRDESSLPLAGVGSSGNRPSWVSMESTGPPSSLYSLSRNLRGSAANVDRHLPAPRLRRGGLRPPESLLPRYTVTLPSLTTEHAHLPRPAVSLFQSDEDEGGRDVDFERDFGQWFNPQEEHSYTAARDEEPTSLPTPRSVSPSPEEVEREVLMLMERE